MLKVTKEELAHIQSYCEFMYNSENEYNCTQCPENVGDYHSKLPCGQQNCWVSCHARMDRDKERYM